MAEIKLKLNNELQFPLEADSITPDNFAEKSVADIKKLVVYYGTKESTIGEFFNVSGKSGDVGDLKIIIEYNVQPNIHPCILLYKNFE